jgi:hypothetical protein
LAKDVEAIRELISMSLSDAGSEARAASIASTLSTWSRSDRIRTIRCRLGVNHAMIPVNAPKAAAYVNSYHRDYDAY